MIAQFVCLSGNLPYKWKSNFAVLNILPYRYDSFTDSSRNEMKRKFALTMEFVEEYLKEVVNQPFPFGDKEKNKLTFEVPIVILVLI